MDMYADEVSLDEAAVVGLVAAQFPAWSGLPLTRVRSSGNVNVLYRLGSDKVVRLPRVPLAHADLEREVHWLPELAPHLPVPVPVPLAKGTPYGDYPWSWGVYSWLRGANPQDDDLARSQSFARDLAGFVLALRRIPVDGAPLGYRGADVGTHDAEVRAALAAADRIVGRSELEYIWDAAVSSPPWSGRPVWTHGDLLPGNVLVERGELVGVIDFGCAGIGDPACDLVPAWALLGCAARETFRESMGADDAMWARGRGWALSIALQALVHFEQTNASFVALAHTMIDQLLAEDQTEIRFSANSER